MMKHFRLIFSMKYFFVYFCSCIFLGVFGQDFLCGTSQLIHRIAFLEFFKLGRTQIDSEFNYSLSPSVMCFIKVNLLSVFGVQSLSHIRLFTAPWTAACQASLSITNSRSLLKLISIELVIPSNHLILSSIPSPPAFSLSQHQGLFQ